MANNTFQINKGVNKSVEFKGLKAQYIWYLGGGLVCLLLLFAILYITGLNTYLCLVIIMTSGGLLFVVIYKLNNKYGEYGIMKNSARKRCPKVIRNNSREIFVK